MKLDILTFCLLCFHFVSLYGADHCSSLTSYKGSCRDMHKRLTTCPLENVKQNMESDPSPKIPQGTSNTLEQNCEKARPSVRQTDFLDSNPQLNDELSKDTFVFYCPLPDIAKSFHMKLFKGKDIKEACILYFDNGTILLNKSEFCYPVYSSCEVKFILSNLKNEHSNNYTCCLEILSPIYGHCKSNESYLYYIQDSGHCLLSETRSWILIGISAFSIAACICCFIACCLRKMICRNASPGSYDYSNEYMSMAAVKFT